MGDKLERCSVTPSWCIDQSNPSGPALAGLRNETIQMKTHPSADGAVSIAVPAADHEVPRVDHAMADESQGSTPGRETRTSPEFATEKPTLQDLQEQVDALKKTVAALNFLLRGVTRESQTLRFTGLNLQIVNGTKSTNGTPNGLGNLILGYNAPRTVGKSVTTAANRAGSHALVIGDQHHWSSYGHIVAGYRNTVSGSSASVTGGSNNTAQGPYASVSGGRNNTAEGPGASVSGGEHNTAEGSGASVSGGYKNRASANRSSVSGGRDNKAQGQWSSVSGGRENIASGPSTSVTGGGENEARGNRSSVSGGYDNTAWGAWSSILGGDQVTLNTPKGCHSC
jgi:hypothetical protein